MNILKRYINIGIVLLGFILLLHITSSQVSASLCPRSACPNKCDLSGTECAPDINGNPATCTADQATWWCVKKIDCNSSYPGGVKQEAYECNGSIWVDKGIDLPTSDCAGYCQNEAPPAPSPTNYPPGAQACKDRPFQVHFRSSRTLGPGEKVVCDLQQNNTACEPCTGLYKNTSCEFGTSFKDCATSGTDCLCKWDGFTYTCNLNGVAFQGGSGTLPPSVIANASSLDVNIDPPGGSALECSLGKTCSNCNGDNTTCYPDCGGGTCTVGATGGACTQCPVNPSVCQVGQSCSGKCNAGNNNICYPGCNGGVCNGGGTCDSCSEAGVVPVVPTLVQQKTVITIAPTFTPLGTTGAAPSKSQRWICLETQPCSDPFSSCSGLGDPKHRVALSTGKTAQAVANRATYIFECLIGTNGLECTSGKVTVDTFALQTDMVTKLGGLYGYNRVGFFKEDGQTIETNPLSSGSKGEINKHEWESTTATSVGHVFFAMNEVNPDEYNGSSASTKQATFIMDAVPYSGCLMITSDPYGRVFDAQTLEPIKGATVTLLKKNTDQKFVPVKNSDVIGGIVNPIVTTEDGAFTFRVPDGTYKIAVESKGYRFPIQKEILNEKYKDIYTNIYKGEEIIQKGRIVHHDIPLAPIDIKKSQIQSKNIKPKMLSLNESIDKAKRIITVQGVVSHPKAIIQVYGKKPSQNKFTRTRLLISDQADKQGKFTIRVKEAALGTDEVVGDIELKKDDQIYSLKTEKNQSLFKSLGSIMSTFIQNVIGSEKELSARVALQPIPTELSGYAYTENHIAIANTKVEIHLPFSNEPVASIKTDENGYFKLSSQYLPSIPYEIQYKTTTGKTITKTTSQFLLENSH